MRRHGPIFRPHPPWATTAGYQPQWVMSQAPGTRHFTVCGLIVLFYFSSFTQYAFLILFACMLKASHAFTYIYHSSHHTTPRAQLEFQIIAIIKYAHTHARAPFCTLALGLNLLATMQTTSSTN